jgi:hypothetical protein
VSSERSGRRRHPQAEHVLRATGRRPTHHVVALDEANHRASARGEVLGAVGDHAHHFIRVHPRGRDHVLQLDDREQPIGSGRGR